MSMSRAQGRLLALSIGTSIALAIGWATYAFSVSREAPLIQMHDRSEEIAFLQEELGLDGLLDTGSERLKRRLLPASIAKRVFSFAATSAKFDPHAYYSHRPYLNIKRRWEEHPDGEWWMRTNSHGWREDEEMSPGKPELRVLVVGDSHSDGVCNNDESFANLAEAGVATARPDERIEFWNAAVGGYSFYNYLGVYESFVVFAPDVFVVAVYGGNDFLDSLKPYHYFHGTKMPVSSPASRKLVNEAVQVCKPAMSQALLSLKYFQEYPRQRDVALGAAGAVMEEIRWRCENRGVRLVCVYIPSLPDAQPHVDSRLEPALRELELTGDDLEVVDDIATRFLAGMRVNGVEVLDMRPAFRASEEPLYWFRDHHINLAGHRLIARELARVILASD